MRRVAIRVNRGDELICNRNLRDGSAYAGKKYKYKKHTVCSDVSLKPVSVAVLVVTAPVKGESNSS
jgi:hypothetical protein